MMRHLALAVLTLLAAVPATIITTLALTPIWRVVEERFGIESIGHSGPADWCFELVYIVFVAAAAGVWLVVRRRQT